MCYAGRNDIKELYQETFGKIQYGKLQPHKTIIGSKFKVVKTGEKI